MSQLENHPSPPPTKRRRIVRRAVVWLFGIVVVLAVLLMFLLPHVVEQLVENALIDAGFEQVSLRCTRATPWRVELRDLSAGAVDPLRVDSVTVTCSPRSLWNGRVHSVSIRGLKVGLFRRDNCIEAGPLSGVLDRSRSAEPKAAAALPFDSIEVADSAIVIGGDEKKPIPFACMVRQKNDRRLAFEGTLGGEKATKFTGELMVEQKDLELHIAGHVVDPGLIEAISTLAGSSVTAGGACELAADVTVKSGRGTVSVLVKPRGAWIGPNRNDALVESLDADLKITAEIDGTRFHNVRGTLSDANFTSPEAGLEFESVAGAFVLNEMDKPTPDDIQQVSVKTIKAGGTVISDASVSFVLREWRELDVMTAGASWMGGTLRTRDVRIDPISMSLSPTIEISKLDLRQLLETFAPNKAAGEGRLSGRLPLRIENGQVVFGDGSLQADGGGRLRIVDTAAVEQTLQAGVQEQAKQNVVEALKDFDYNQLRAQLSSGSGGLTAFVRIAGRGRTGQQQQLDLDLRISGLDDLLAAYLGIRGKLSPGN